MEGIMNLPANVGGATSQDGLDSFAPLIAAQQAARDMGYPRFTRELLSAGSEMDQAEVQEFLQTIRDAGLTSEDVALMRRVVEAVFGDPNNYPEVRARLLAEGVPEDILPETFDLEFFVALRMAVEEAENLSQEPRPTGQEMPMDMPVGMAEGGIVSSIRSALDRMQEQPVPVNTGEGRGSITSSIRSALDRMREAQGEKPLARRESREEVIERLREQYPSLFSSLTPVRMAEGGIVGLPQMTPIAREMAAMGRNGDTMLAHITPQEAMMLQRMGGSGTINPYTGLPEFFLGKALKSIGKGISKAVNGVVKGVKKFAKSTVGRIVIGVALGAFLGPMATGFLSGTMGVTLSAAAATGISAGIGVFGSSLLAGDGFKNSLRNGLTAGALTYGTAGLMGDFSTPATNAPANFARGYEQGLDNITSPFRKAADFIRGGPEAAANVPAPGVSPVGDATSQVYSLDPTKAFQPTQGTQGFGTNVTQGLEFGLPDPASVNVPSNLGQGLPGGPGYPGGRLAGINVEQGLPSGLPDPASISGDLGQGPNFFDRAVKGAQDVYTGAKDVYTDYLSPSRASIQPPSLQDAVAQVKADYVSAGLKVPADDIVMASAKKLVTEQTPGFMAKYGPIAAVAGTTLAATGGLNSLFKVPEQEPGESYEAYVARRDAAVAKFRQERPEFFGSFLPQSFAEGSGPNGVENPVLERIKSSALLSRLFSKPSAEEENNAGIVSLLRKLKGSGLPISSQEDVPLGSMALFPPNIIKDIRKMVNRSNQGQTQRQTFDIERLREERPELFGSLTPMTYAQGTGPQGVEDFPRKNGAINGPGTGTSDDIPAMLSDGEFVFTAKSVRNMGGGSRRKGAAKMYKLMKMLEGGPVGKTAKA